MKRGKKYKKALEFLNPEMAYWIDEAVDLLEKTNTVKFDPTIEIHYNLNLDPKHADQMIRSTISLPNGSGKTSKVCAFTDWNAKELEGFGASIAWWEELISDIEKWNIDLNFDVCVATPTMMRHLWKIARVLWPKWLMPNPKAGTVWPNLEAIIKEIMAWKFEFRNDKQGNVHSYIGKLSFWKEKLKENLEYFIKIINDIKPTWSKGKYINTVFICNAMWPSIRLDMNEGKS